MKNNYNFKNIMFSAIGKEHKNFIYNNAVFLLVITVADSALFSYETLNNIRRQEIPAGKNELILRYKESALK